MPGQRSTPPRVHGGRIGLFDSGLGSPKWSALSFMARPKGPFLNGLVAVAEAFAMDVHRSFFP